uniref:Uncharacterized protein n=1 Tax=Avena sativa TaxID=4498 RepID=A0ACD5YZ31_AVESA
MAGSIILKLVNEWEIELLILLSFALQLFLFFFGALRRRSNQSLVQLPLWLAYLSADAVAIYALGYLSHNFSTTISTNNGHAMSNKNQLLKLLWVPFLLVHLGGQDTLTAYALEDNELWLRHMLTLLSQVSLVLYVLFKSVVAYDRLVVPAIFVFVTGVIKYVERIWALKQASQKSLKSSIPKKVGQSAQSSQQIGGTTLLTYPAVLKSAIGYEADVRNLFAGRTYYQMMQSKLFRPLSNFHREYHGDEGNNSALFFKGLEVELSMMYDLLFTKCSIIRTTLGTILRCISLTSTMVAFVLFIVMMGARRKAYGFSTVDTTITYILFIGAVCLEGCSVFILMMSPQTWATLQAGGWRVLARVSWFILVKMQPESRPWWSNSMAQYNLVGSLIDDKKSGIFFTTVTKIAGVVGLGEPWHKMRHVKYAQVPEEIKKMMDKTFDRRELRTLSLPAPMSHFKLIIGRFPFELAVLSLHVWTERLIQKMRESVDVIPEEKQKPMDLCKGMSDYMIHLLAVNPAMLPVNSDVDELVGNFKKNIQDMSEEQFHEALVFDLLGEHSRIIYDREGFKMEERKLLQEQGEDLHAVFDVLVQVWFRMLMYAAGKCRPEEHARRLAMGGELLTFLWLGMLNRGMGDQSSWGVYLMRTDGALPGSSTMASLPLFSP